MPKVSIIVPVYKVESTLNRCIDSIRKQTLEDIEIILVDDGSPDNCPVMCDELAEIDERIKVIHKSNGGLGYARNSGMEIASGEYIGFVDSDDYIEPNMMQRLYDFASKNKCDVVYGGYNIIREGKKIGEWVITEKDTVLSTENELLHLLMDLIASDISVSEDSKYGATVWKAIFSNEIIKRFNVRFYSEREYVSEDGLFDIDFISKCRKGGLISGTYYNYEYNPDSLTSSYRSDRFEKNKQLFSLGSQKLREYYANEEIIKQYGRMFIAASRVCLMQEAWNTNRDGIRITVNRMHRINRDEMLRSVLNNFPWRKLPFKKRVFCYLMHHDLVLIELLAIKMLG